MTPGFDYANRRRNTRAAIQPRNMAAVPWARDKQLSLVVSFVGDTPWPFLPTIYCDSGGVYGWDFVKTLPCPTIIAVKPGIDAVRAIRAIFERSNLMIGYPVIADVENEEVACVVDGNPFGLWQVKRGTELWKLYFERDT